LSAGANHRQRTERVAVPLTPEELDEIKIAAERDETTLAAFFRVAALRAARSEAADSSEAAFDAAVAHSGHRDHGDRRIVIARIG
jgi:uncharacterized protein (DUF1778 family)